MAQRPKTRDRIVLESLGLFNARGERNVTTNHIATHLGISPGNLYYHFRNKREIIADLFVHYEARVDAFLRLPEGRGVTLEDKTYYLESLLAAMWDFRFLHRDLEHLLESDALLARRYRLFSQRCLAHAQGIYLAFVEAGILNMTPAQVEALALNSWIVVTSWVRFLCTTRIDAEDLNHELLCRGIYQVLALEGGYLAPKAHPAVKALYEKFYVPLEEVVSG